MSDLLGKRKARNNAGMRATLVCLPLPARSRRRNGVGSRRGRTAAAARAEHLERRASVPRRHAPARDREPERRRLPRPGDCPLPARPRGAGSGPGGRDRRGQAAGEGDLADAAEARRRAALDLVEAPQGHREPHVPAPLHRHGHPRRTACLRLRAAACVAADQRPRRAHPRRRGRVREAKLRPGRAGSGLDLDRLPERADPLLLVPERRVRRYPGPEHECDPGDAVDPPRLARAPQRAVRPPGDAVGRLAGRPLLPARDDVGRPDRVRAGDPSA